MLKNPFFESGKSHGLVLEGDIQEASKWINYAERHLIGLLARNPGPTALTLKPLDTVTVRIYSRPNKIHIIAEISGLYLECGIAQVFGWSLVSSAHQAYRPAVIHFTPEVDSEFHSLGSLFGYCANKAELPSLPAKYKFTISGERVGNPDRGFNGHGHNDALDSISIGCFQADRSHDTVYQDGDVEVPVHDETAWYCDHVDFYAMTLKKRIITQHPSSLYQGKMQLYIQALYGSQRKDFGLVESACFRAPYLELPLSPSRRVSSLKPIPTPSEGAATLVLDPYTVAYGVYTTSDYRYYLVAMTRTQAMFYTLLPDANGEKWLSDLAGAAGTLSEAELLKVEGYILSTCTIGRLVASVAFDREVVGESFFYSWRLKWDCTEGMYIGHVADNSVKLMKSQAYKADIKITTTIAATGSSTPSEGVFYVQDLGDNTQAVDVFTVALSDYAGGGHWKVYSHLTWVPDFGTGGMVIFADPWGPLAESTYTTYTSLVYGMYTGMYSTSMFEGVYYSSVADDVSGQINKSWSGGGHGNTPNYGMAGTEQRDVSAPGKDATLRVTARGNSVTAEVKAASSYNKSSYDGIPAKASDYETGTALYVNPIGDIKVLMEDMLGLQHLSLYSAYVIPFSYVTRGHREWRVLGARHSITELAKSNSGETLALIPYWDCSGIFSISNTRTESDGDTDIVAPLYSFSQSSLEAYACVMGEPNPLPPESGGGPNTVSVSFDQLGVLDLDWYFDIVDLNNGNGMFPAGPAEVVVTPEYVRYDIEVHYSSANFVGSIYATEEPSPPMWLQILTSPHASDVHGETGLFTTGKRGINSPVQAVFVDPNVKKVVSYDHDSAIGWA